jgi:hypothetical protein
MSRTRSQSLYVRPVANHQFFSSVPVSHHVRLRVPLSKRARGGEHCDRQPFVPPEDWYEPEEEGNGYRIVVREPGSGYRHVLTPDEICQRLDQLPEHFCRRLEVVQLSRVTRKKRSFPCYGMQWGATIYLYPIEDDLVEHFPRPPKPVQYNEARMYGGRWEQEGNGAWRLIWTEAAVKDFYLNNILIHELGHLLDDRNSGYQDRERFAEWFAVRYGYLASRGTRPPRPVVRRHHRKVRMEG